MLIKDSVNLRIAGSPNLTVARCSTALGPLAPRCDPPLILAFPCFLAAVIALRQSPITSIGRFIVLDAALAAPFRAFALLPSFALCFRGRPQHSSACSVHHSASGLCVVWTVWTVFECGHESMCTPADSGLRSCRARSIFLAVGLPFVADRVSGTVYHGVSISTCSACC